MKNWQHSFRQYDLFMPRSLDFADFSDRFNQQFPEGDAIIVDSEIQQRPELRSVRLSVPAAKANSELASFLERYCTSKQIELAKFSH